MKLSSNLPRGFAFPNCFAVCAGASPLLLAVVLVIGLVIGALLVYRLTKPQAPKGADELAQIQFTLSDAAKSTLAKLSKPVNMRLYVLFPDNTIPANLREHSDRVNDLVSELERFANGRIAVTRFTNWSRENTQSATKDGVTPLTLPQGDPCFVGIALQQENRQEALAQLAPEWFSALEFDIARAISRVGSAPVVPPSAETLAQTGKAEESVKRTIPDPASTSLEAGKQILRNASLKAYQALVGQMNSEVQNAEQAVQKASSDAERQAALQKLQQLRTSFADRLRDIALQSQAEVEVWTKLKGQ